MLRTLKEAILHFEEMMASHPERDYLVAEEAAWSGQPTRYLSAMGIRYRIDPLDTTPADMFMELPPTQFPDDEEGRLAHRIVQALEPLDMINPVHRAVGLEGAGTPADLIPSFGTPKCDDGGAPAYTLPLVEMLKRPAPDPETAGLMPTFRKSAAFIRDHTPPSLKINMPDMQGPYNLAHALIGDDAFTAPYTDPGDFHKFMDRITDFWIAANDLLMAWIGPA